VGRIVGVKVGRGVSVAIGTIGVSVEGVVVGGNVLSTNRLGVLVGSNENGVTVGLGKLIGVDVPKNGIEIGNPEHPERRIIIARTKISFFIEPLRR